MKVGGPISASCQNLQRTAVPAPTFHRLPWPATQLRWSLSPRPRVYRRLSVDGHISPQAVLLQSYSQRLHYSTNPSDVEASREVYQRKQEEKAVPLRLILDELPGPIDNVVAYGSGVMKQANAAGGSNPMIDLIITTPSNLDFHAANLTQNPSHYPLHARVLGASWVTWIQESFGAGAWFIPMVRLANMDVKYGIVSTTTFNDDLLNWKTFYFAGRMQKPTLLLRSLPGFKDQGSPYMSNLASAYHLARLLLSTEQPVNEIELFEKIAGLSYAGDPRMSVPGAENPEKVRNIVRAEDALEAFRQIYQLDEDPEDRSGARLTHAMKINSTFRARLLQHFSKREPGKGNERVDVKEEEKQPLLDIEAKGDLAESDESRRMAWAISQPDFDQIALKTLRDISYGPALIQSMKGLFTAGLWKSIKYSLEKFRKSLQGRRTRDPNSS